MFFNTAVCTQDQTLGFPLYFISFLKVTGKAIAAKNQVQRKTEHGKTEKRYCPGDSTLGSATIEYGFHCAKQGCNVYQHHAKRDYLRKQCELHNLLQQGVSQSGDIRIIKAQCLVHVVVEAAILFVDSIKGSLQPGFFYPQ